MSRKLFAIEGGLRVYAENSDLVFIDYLGGAGAPSGTAGVTDEAPVGSQYNDSSNGDIYKKVASTSSASDWSKLGDVTIDELAWRNEKVRFATGEVLSAGTLDVDAIGDNDGGLVYADMVLNDVMISDVDGTPSLFKVDSLDGAPNVTISAYTPIIKDSDTFIVQKYLPDTPANQESLAIIHFPLASGAGLKIADINWNLADGITLNGYTDTVGAVAGSDTVQIAIQKIEKGLKDVLASLGIARNAVDMGVYVNPITPDNTDQVAINEALGLAISLNQPQQQSGTIPQNTPTIVDGILVDDFQMCAWLVTVRDTANPAKVKSLEIQALHDGSLSADAVESDDAVAFRLNTANFNLSVDIGLVGAAGAQVMNLSIESSLAGGVNYTIERLHCLPLAG